MTSKFGELRNYIDHYIHIKYAFNTACVCTYVGHVKRNTPCLWLQTSRVYT